MKSPTLNPLMRRSLKPSKFIPTWLFISMLSVALIYSGI